MICKNWQRISATVGMRYWPKYYHNKKDTKNPSEIYPHRQAMHTPFCIDCRFYIPMEHSNIFPNSACDLYKPLKACTYIRSQRDLCGPEGIHFIRKLPC